MTGPAPRYDDVYWLGMAWLEVQARGRPFKVIVSGGRDFIDWAAVYQELRLYPEGTILVHGDCRRAHGHRKGEECPATCPAWRSADRIADRLGRALGFEVVPMPANWSEHGNAAGPIRNTVMTKTHADADSAIVFDGGPGTRDFTRKAVAAHIPVYGGGRTDRTSLTSGASGAEKEKP